MSRKAAAADVAARSCARKHCQRVVQVAHSDFRFLVELAQIFNQAGAAARLTGDAGVAAVQDKPVVAVDLEFLRHDLQQLSSTCSTLLPGAKRVRLHTRKM